MHVATCTSGLGIGQCGIHDIFIGEAAADAIFKNSDEICEGSKEDKH